MNKSAIFSLFFLAIQLKCFIVNCNLYSVDRLENGYSNEGVIERTKYHTLLAMNGDRHTVTRRI